MEREWNLKGELHIMKETGIKPNFSDLARRYNVDRHTVAKYWNSGDPEPVDGRTTRPSSFDRYEGDIRERAELPGTTAVGVYEWLMHRHGEEEPPLAGYGAFTHWLRTRSIVVGESPSTDAHPRFETEPGEQLQFDWKEDLSLHDRSGELFEFSVFTATLSFSRLHVMVLVQGLTREVLLLCMYLTLVRLGGTPRLWLTDNMSAYVVTGPDGKRHKSERVDRFAKDAGFEIATCKPRTPQTKGKDESANRFVNRVKAYEGDFDGLDGLREVIAHIERRSNETPNRTTGMPPNLLFARKEKDALRPVGNMRLLEQSLGESRRQVVPSTMLVSARGRQWSVPRRCIGHEVRTVVQPGGTLLVFMGNELVATHDTAGEARPIVYDPAHYAEAISDKRWGGMDADIERAARENLARIDALGGGLL